MDKAIARLDDPEDYPPIQLHLKGTAFQLSIWQKLVLVPLGGLITYSDLGEGTKNARATGSAVAANPIAYILPCHRVIRSDGSFNQYYWENS